MTTVVAVVVTYNDPVALDSCLASLADQTRQPDVVVVVDNARTPPARTTYPKLDMRVIRTESNGGPAGGFADGFEAALAGPCDYIWAMDDDCEPEPDALGTLLIDVNERTVVFPQLVSSGTRMHRPARCGVMIPRRVAEEIGVPRRDFVWWMEDTEYLQWRVPKAGFASFNSRVCPQLPSPQSQGQAALEVLLRSAKRAFLPPVPEPHQYGEASLPADGQGACGNRPAGRSTPGMPLDAPTRSRRWRSWSPRHASATRVNAADPAGMAFIGPLRSIISVHCERNETH